MFAPRFALVCLVALVWPAAAAAQYPFEPVGGRAQGMAGAFVAVADDASAVFWNPAGLASGQPFGATVEWSWVRPRDPDAPLQAGLRRGDSGFTSLGTWPLGLSFGHRVSTLLVEGPDDGIWAETVATRDFGVTVLQTLVPGLVIGSTLKYVRGATNFAPAATVTAGEALELAEQADRRTTGAFDLDVGLMADMERVRLGIMVKNLREPEFGEMAETSITLQRQTRVGIAVLPTDGLTLAMDFDLNTVDLRGGLRRMIAMGGESRLGTRLAVRGGVRWNREGAREPVATVGASVAVRSGLWLDGHYAHGRTGESRRFGVALRAGY